MNQFRRGIDRYYPESGRVFLACLIPLRTTTNAENTAFNPATWSMTWVAPAFRNVDTLATA